MSKPNQIRYNAKISAIRVEINKEKLNFVEIVRQDIQRLLERRSPVDMGDLKKSWRVTITNKHKLAGNSLQKLQSARPITLGISIESTSRHAIAQMFGWNAVPGQLLTGYKKSGNRWHILQASHPIFKISDNPKHRVRPKHRISTFVTRGGKHKPNPDLAFDEGAHSIRTEIKRIVARRLKECKYLSSVVYIHDDLAKVWSLNKERNRIQKWMAGTLNVELNSTATDVYKR